MSDLLEAYKCNRFSLCQFITSMLTVIFMFSLQLWWYRFLQKLSCKNLRFAPTAIIKDYFLIKLPQPTRKMDQRTFGFLFLAYPYLSLVRNHQNWWALWFIKSILPCTLWSPISCKDAIFVYYFLKGSKNIIYARILCAPRAAFRQAHDATPIHQKQQFIGWCMVLGFSPCEKTGNLS